MSCYNWEEGTITIPTKEWAKFRTTLIKAWNDHETGRLEKARALHARVKAAIKGTRGKKRHEVFKGFYDRHDELVYSVIEMKYDREKNRRVFSLKELPKKKDFKILPTSKDADIHLGDGSIYLRNKGRRVTWSVSENNRAVEHAREHVIARKLFGLLGQIEWTRGSGGEIVGNDEYNRDCRDSGGGGNYVTATYRPLTAKEKKAKAEAARRSSYGGYGSFGYGRRW